MRIGLKTMRALAIMIVMVLTVSAMSVFITGSPATGTVSAADEGYVGVGWLSEIVNWNPLAIEMVEDYVACYLVYSALFTYDQNWNGPVYDLATGYYQRVNPTTGVMTTTINITDTAYFRNAANIDDTSHPLTADDVVFSFQTMKDNTGATFDWYLEEVSNITKVNNYAFSMDTPYAKATLIDDIASMPIVPKYLWETYPNALASMNPGELVGSGPFVFESYLKGSWYKYMTAPNYHGTSDYGAERTVKIDGILYTVYTSTQGLTQDINSGVQDFAVLTGDMRSFLEALGAGASVNVYKAAVQEPGICDIAINAIPASFVKKPYGSHHAALNDPNVRKAIMMTLNKDYIVNVTLEGYGKIGSSVVQPGFWQADIQNQLPYDPVAAEAWLNSHGWNVDSDGDGYWEAAAGNGYGVPAGTELTGIRCQAPDTDPTYATIGEAWQGWAAEAGIGLVYTTESEITMINVAWYKADYDIWVWHWGWGPEPMGGALSCWLTSEIETGGDNCQMPMGPWWYGNDNYTDAPEEWGLDGAYSAFDQNMSLAMNTLDIGARKVILDKLQQWVYDSYCENPPYYDLGLYGYTDANFDNWGEVSEHSGLNVASDLLWIWFNVKQVTNRAPVFNTVPEESYVTYVADETPFVTIEVSDSEGDDIIVEFEWGDGESNSYTVSGATTPTEVTAGHGYAIEGVYDLNVSITDEYVDPTTGLRDPIVRTAVVEVQGEVNQAPNIISLASNPTSQAYVYAVTTWTIVATDLESWQDGAKITWDWDDGTYNVTAPTPVGQQVTSTVTHAWTTPDAYSVEISVFDYGGIEGGDSNVSTTRAYNIVVNQPPTVPAIQAMNGVPGQPLTCKASSSDVDPDILTFTWDWDDGTYSVTVNTPSTVGAIVTSTVSHTWDTEANYTVTVYVDDGKGHNVSNTRIAVIAEGINVAPGSFELDVTPYPVNIDVVTTLNASASDANGDVLVLTIDFGDESNNLSATTAGGTYEAQYAEFEHTYAEPGTYMVTVYAYDGEFNESAEFTVVVIENAAPILEVQSSFTAVYNVPQQYQPVDITDADGDTITVWYNWGDGTPMTMGAADRPWAANHTYTATGSFQLTISADDGMGHNVSAERTATVVEANKRATATMNADKNEITAGETVMFTVSVGDFEGDSSTVKIEFGDGTTDIKEDVDLDPQVRVLVYFNHTFDTAGVFKVNVTADDGQDHYNKTLYGDIETITVAKKSTSLLLIAGIGIAVVVAILAAVMLMKRKKKGGEGMVMEGGSGMEGMAPPEEPPPPQA